MTRHPHRQNALALAATLALAACAPAAPIGTEAGARYATIHPFPDPPPPPMGNCPEWMCNAATVGDGLVFDELSFQDLTSQGPLLNSAGLYVSKAELNGRPVRFTVQGNEVVLPPLTGPNGGGPARTGDVDGLVLTVTHASGAEYELLFKQTIRAKYWVNPSGEVPYHEIRVRKTRQGSENGFMIGRAPEAEYKASLCAGTPDPREGEEVTELAVLFEGDRYDNAAKTVKEVPPGGPWFNVACAGTAMLKMHLLRYTRASESTPVAVPQRQALLKTLTADYCGDGRPFTVNGHPLIYTDALDLVPGVLPDIEALLAKGATVEAIWGPEGARCLDVPRLVARDQVSCPRHIALRSCGDVTSWKQRGGVLSLNPPPGGP
jgi:hypothetical protein